LCAGNSRGVSDAPASIPFAIRLRNGADIRLGLFEMKIDAKGGEPDVGELEPDRRMAQADRATSTNSLSPPPRDMG
jgi:hypothetical protein